MGRWFVWNPLSIERLQMPATQRDHFSFLLLSFLALIPSSSFSPFFSFLSTHNYDFGSHQLCFQYLPLQFSNLDINAVNAYNRGGGGNLGSRYVPPHLRGQPGGGFDGPKDDGVGGNFNGAPREGGYRGGRGKTSLLQSPKFWLLVASSFFTRRC